MAAKKQMVGMCVDGAGLKIAILSRERGTIRVDALVKDVLPRSLEERAEGEDALSEEEGGQREDAFGFEEDEDRGEFEEAEEITNQSVFLGLLGEFPLKGWPFATNMPASRVYYYEFERDFGLKKPGKLRKRLQRELQNTYQMDVPADAIDFLRLDNGGLLVATHDSGLGAMELVEEVKSFLQGGANIALVDSNEIALMNLVRVGYTFSDEEVVAIVYIGEESSRIIFMRGNRYLSFGGIVNEGRTSPRVLNALFAKILLEQDVSGMPDINRFLLAGACGEVDARAFFTSQFPDAQVDDLAPPQLDVSQLGEDQQISEFAIPIALAWKALGEKKGVFYETDFVPKRIRDRQNAYKLAWHGFMVMGLLAVAVLVFLQQWKSKSEAIRDTQRSIRHLETSIADTRADLASFGSLDSLHSQITRYETDLAFMDTLTQGTKKWSPILEQLARQTRSLRSFWFESFSSRGDVVTLRGRALHRSGIPRMSERLGDALLQTVSPSEIRGKDLYQFELGYKFSADGTVNR